MSIYTEDANGNITLLKQDVTLADLASEGKAIMEEQGLDTSCEAKNIEESLKPKTAKNSLGD